MLFTTLTALLMRSPIGKLLSLDETIEASGTDDRSELLDQTGTALTDLRPGGRAMIDGRRVDVIARTGFIDVGTPIRVIKVAGNQITVEITTAPISTEQT